MILHEQADMKVKCQCHFSQEKTVIMILRKWGRVKNLTMNGVPLTKIADELE